MQMLLLNIINSPNLFVIHVETSTMTFVVVLVIQRLILSGL